MENLHRSAVCRNALAEHRHQRSQHLVLGADVTEVRHRCGDVLLELGLALVAAEIAVGAEGLHETLHGAEVVEGAVGADAGKAGDAKAGAAAPKAGAAPAKKEPEKKK